MNLRGLFKKKEKIQEAGEAGSGVFLWFNRELIRKSGNINYGRYIYRNLLPLFAVKVYDISQIGIMPLGIYQFYDGKVLPEGKVDLPVRDATQAAILKEASFDNFSAIYVVAFYSQTKVDYAALDLKMHNLVGYIGMTSCEEVSFHKFYELTGQLALPCCITLHYETIKDEGAGFFLDKEELQKMGFFYKGAGG